MNRYVLGLLVILSCAVNSISASALNSAAVEISYTYRNNTESRAAGLVPRRFHQDVDDESHTVKLNVYLYGPRTAEDIKRIVTDEFDLNDFAKLHLWIGRKKMANDHTFTVSKLSRIGSLRVDYIPEENTLECIKNRRIDWLVGQLVGNQKTPESWMKVRMISDFVRQNLVDENGRYRSDNELREMALNL